jgi:hypothetical protein
LAVEGQVELQQILTELLVDLKDLVQVLVGHL